ncbi:peptidoglycan DD-metalloendopeptidase family protein [Stutzerimonas stutzeri]|jgi:murein DD-endopeptidase MepM/ murein hydrolase activator NlpD|uniref:OapA family protein n=1 Tax=Stutzerimonas stutzeri TaxID=316 RepID=UPI000F78A186|nr:peptidoglycan DD-metalloendopeptidase family protein [Stutzerimonas stutzeri]MCQ4227989.1 peptidoglycan DD-metalloendopeptidase family protein [Stutzerimonas stutzeri]MCQ4237885.1 peptidoglycan DD-metalloendopeptidase family protein [Stutzerimonas stutzeri]MDH0445753.1 peptidoglycan DD-metalloendopeptidase family protein [Stutzerimonas stutzeri]MDI9730382.1 peptidoglycan DD-metalloendopeptidase family protein [Stutzerimonas stutzeri]MDI9738486.1 peptidoglycan DD-metalloendopeptidase family 
MMPSKSKAPNYPKSHLLAASGVAALLSLALLVFPSREVEAKKTFLDLKLESSGQIIAEPDTTAQSPADSPFAYASDMQISEQASSDEGTPEAPTGEPVAETDPLAKSVVVANGDTLSTVFAKVGLSPAVMHAVLASSPDAKQLSRLKIGQTLEIQLTEQGELASLRSKLNSLETLALEQTPKGYVFKKEQVKPEVSTAYARGEIDSSLFLAAKRAGLSHNLTMDLANVFGYDIDFALDIRKGDSFEVIYEEKTVEGQRVGTGNILAARFTNRGKTYSAVRYTSKDGTTSYYNADGTSMRKAFIRTPVDFARISSRFSNGRKHPILNKIRAHKGVDYAAPHGTPIKSAGDGKVLLAGRKGGYGNTVIIQHGQRYRTLYAHMQGFAKGVRNGSTVKQGQIIGYIGTTGLSTGPHLHYEFQVDGVHVDPLGLKLPMADPIAKSEMPRFMQQSQPLMARMDEERATMLALNRQ